MQSRSRFMQHLDFCGKSHSLNQALVYSYNISALFISDGSSSEETGSDKVLAFAVSPSGKLLALTDDTKRLVLFSCEPSWHCISIRYDFTSVTQFQ